MNEHVIDNDEGTKHRLTVGMKAVPPSLRIKSCINKRQPQQQQQQQQQQRHRCLKAVMINKLNDTNTTNMRERIQDEYVRLLTSHPPQTFLPISATAFTASSSSCKKEKCSLGQGKGLWN